jgi:hypothetical protein
VVENRVLRRIFGPKIEKVTEWRNLHNEEYPNLRPNIIKVIKLRLMR